MSKLIFPTDLPASLQNQTMVCAFNKAAKILTGIGACFTIVGVIIVIAGTIGTAASFDIETQGGSTSFSLEMSGGSGSLYSVYVRSSYDCDANPVDVTVEHSSGADGTHYESCRALPMDESESWEKSHDPPLRYAGFFSQASENDCGRVDENGAEQCALAGTYRITCSTQCWVVDSLEEVGEAIGGLMAAFGLLIASVIVFCVGAILCFVACCCCCQGPDKGAAPPPVQGMVVGQPVGSA